jgi:hypothetical protein
VFSLDVERETSHVVVLVFVIVNNVVSVILFSLGDDTLCLDDVAGLRLAPLGAGSKELSDPGLKSEDLGCKGGQNCRVRLGQRGQSTGNRGPSLASTGRG